MRAITHNELGTFGAQKSPEGKKSSPKKRNPFPCPPKQWPITFCVRPKPSSCDTRLDFPLARPSTPSTYGEGN